MPKKVKEKPIPIIQPDFPPVDNESSKLESFVCEPETGGCGFVGDAWMQRDKPITAKCPECAGQMGKNWSGIRFFINQRGIGKHSGSYGDRLKRSMREKSEKLAKKQWDNHPVHQQEGVTPRNPTPGGPLDPNGPFAKKKKSKKIIHK